MTVVTMMMTVGIAGDNNDDDGNYDGVSGDDK